MVKNRALTYRDARTPASITVQELDLDSCFSDNEIVIRVHAAAFNPVDAIMHRLAIRWITGRHLKTYGRDYAGEIVKVGKNVEGWSIGDKVCGTYMFFYNQQGAMRDYFVINPTDGKNETLTKLPEFKDDQYNDYVLGAAWGVVFVTAYQGFTNYGQKFGPDSKVLVLGATTSVGNSLVQIAKNHFKIGTVVGTCATRSVDYNKKCGFDHLITYDEGDVSKKLEALIANDLKGEKFDLIYDTVGYGNLLSHINDFLKPKAQNSRYVTCVGDQRYNYKNPTFSMLFPSAKVFNPFRSYNYHLLMAYPTKENSKALQEMVSKGEYKPVIDSVLPLEDFQNGLDKLENNAARGKIVFSLE